MELPLDYTTLRVIWWGLLGVLLIGFALTDGYDLGVASLLPFVATAPGAAALAWCSRRMAAHRTAPVQSFDVATCALHHRSTCNSRRRTSCPRRNRPERTSVPASALQ